MRGRPDDVSTATGSSKVTLTWITVPIPYAPLAFGDETDETLGCAVSTRRRPSPPSRPSPPGSGSVRFAALPVLSLIVPPLSERADVPL